VRHAGWNFVLTTLAAGMLVLPPRLPAQQAAPVGPVVQAPFASWQRPAPEPRPSLRLARAVRPDRTRRALIGGAIGATAGVVFCTAVSTLSNDSANGGLSTCPVDSYLLIGGAGFIVGFAIGWLS
jgi:hypothetical protein